MKTMRLMGVMGAMLLVAASALGQTEVRWNLLSMNGASLNRPILIVPEATQNPRRSGSNLVSGIVTPLQPRQGKATNWLMPGDYWVHIEGLNRLLKLSVYQTNIPVQAVDLMTNLVTYTYTNSTGGVTVPNVLFSSDGMTNQAGYLATSGNAGVAIGYNSSGLQSGVALGYAASANLNGVAIGNEPNADDNGVAIGSSTIAGNYGIAIGSGAAGTINGVAIGNGGFAASYGASIGGNSQASNYGVALGFGATGSDNGVGVGNGTDGSGFGVAVGSGATSGGGAGSVALGGAYGTNTAAVPNGWTNTVELGPGTATLPGGLNFRGYGIINSNGVFYVNGRPGITTNVLCGSRTLLITNGIVLGVQ